MRNYMEWWHPRFFFYLAQGLTLLYELTDLESDSVVETKFVIGNGRCGSYPRVLNHFSCIEIDDLVVSCLIAYDNFVDVPHY